MRRSSSAKCALYQARRELQVSHMIPRFVGKWLKESYLNRSKTREMMKQLYGYFESKVEVPRIRVGKRQTIENLINEEAMLLAKFLRGERESWTPRIPKILGCD